MTTTEAWTHEFIVVADANPTAAVYAPAVVLKDGALAVQIDLLMSSSKRVEHPDTGGGVFVWLKTSAGRYRVHLMEAPLPCDRCSGTRVVEGGKTCEWCEAWVLR